MYSCLTDLFETELFICKKMNLAFNNLKWLIWDKIQTTNQPFGKLFDIDLYIYIYIYQTCINQYERKWQMIADSIYLKEKKKNIYISFKYPFKYRYIYFF